MAWKSPFDKIIRKRERSEDVYKRQSQEHDRTLKTHADCRISFQIFWIDEDIIGFSDDVKLKFVDPFFGIWI